MLGGADAAVTTGPIYGRGTGGADAAVTTGPRLPIGRSAATLEFPIGRSVVALELPIGRSAAAPSQRHGHAQEKPMKFLFQTHIQRVGLIGLGPSTVFFWCGVKIDTSMNNTGHVFDTNINSCRPLDGRNWRAIIHLRVP
jgi:hypothetical protein